MTGFAKGILAKFLTEILKVGACTPSNYLQDLQFNVWMFSTSGLTSIDIRSHHLHSVFPMSVVPVDKPPA